MASNDKTKYYWLKLSKDFFQKHQIRVIEGMKNGKEYVLFYLKLMVEATSWNGELRFSETIPYSEEMLSTLTNTPIDTVHAAMEVFRQLQLVEILDDGTLFIEEVTRITGVETGKAIRCREYRERLAAGSEEAQTSQEIRVKRLESRRETTDFTNVQSSVSKIKTDLNRQKHSALCQILVDWGYLNENELEDPQWESLVGMYVNMYGFTDVKIKVLYFLGTVCEVETATDRDGKFTYRWVYDKETKPIANKYLYFATSMEESFRRFGEEAQ